MQRRNAGQEGTPVSLKFGRAKETGKMAKFELTLFRGQVSERTSVSSSARRYDGMSAAAATVSRAQALAQANALACRSRLPSRGIGKSEKSKVSQDAQLKCEVWLSALIRHFMAFLRYDIVNKVTK